MANRKELNPDASPQAALGARLRREREQRDWKQRELGERMGYSPTQVSHVETALKVATLPFCRAVDVVLGLAGTEESFEREWLGMKYGALLEGFPGFVGYEGRAVEVRLYEVGVIPGLLQTPEYAAVLADAYVERGAITDDQAKERTGLTAKRQAALVRTPPPLIFVVLDEGCIRRPVGGPAVMGAQLDRLLEFAEQPNASLQVAPFSMGERRPFNLPITVLTLPDRSLVFYAESAARGHLEREGRFVVPTLTAYHQLQKHALSQADSVAMINQVRKGTP
ncbi:transcriptional regulator [Streptomyces inusitatus]|uniref:Transcriptional regulator n=1 Tax=Streptomyces inusitatus TaxID=68221 RepID=A0A918PPY0_9ACTN|nr:helix-turn-helix transcriptional regulator [Streptomyces inusitatus]GGZ18606.1 transcriptional regulator [Streptomyces inusitatus]